MLQLPVPNVLTQLRLTVPVKPSCEEIVIGPVVPVLPAFTLGKAAGSVSTKVGFRIRPPRMLSSEARVLQWC